MNVPNTTQNLNPLNAEAPLSAKWAAVIADKLVFLPCRQLKAREILVHAQASAGTVLVRDLDKLANTEFSENDVVDLSDGNVFRLSQNCNITESSTLGEKEKFAFVINNTWAVTISPAQTVESLRRLFNLEDELELLRVCELPGDMPIGDTEPITFVDGPVFHTHRGLITVDVNTKPVQFTKHRVTGLVIKQTAVKQGVAIKTDFVLYRDLPNGGLSAAIGNEQYVNLHDGEKFTCVAPDDNSQVGDSP